MRVAVKVPALWDPEVYGNGIVTEMFKKEDVSVKRGESICLIMAAKVRVDVTSPADGKIIKILADEGDEVTPGDLIAEIETE